MLLYCATGNPGKLREFQLAGRLLNIEIAALPGLKSVLPPEETGLTFEANARLKAEYYSRLTPGPVFADDSGLSVDALNGAPGVYSARYAGEHATGRENNALLLDRLRPHSNRRARFVCVIALAENGLTKAAFRGEVEGSILREPHGPGGFGYDPLFYYPPSRHTFGELDETRKFAVSHRGAAMRLMLQYLTNAPGS